VPDANRTRGRVDEDGREERGIDRARPALLQHEALLLHEAAAAQRAADFDAGRVLFILGNRQPRLVDGLLCRGDRVLDEE